MDYPENKNISPGPNPKFETGMGPITDRILNELINGISIDTYESRINDKLVDPITRIINKRVQPYMYLSAGLYIIIIILLLVIIYMLFSQRS
jgi:hypothetical protein